MTNQDFGSPTAAAPSGNAQGVGNTAREAFSQAADLARDAGTRAREAAGETASTLAGHVHDLLDRQVAQGATMAGHVARSARVAADELESDAPMLAGLMRTGAGKLDDVADSIEGKGLDDLTRAASDWTRRQPALVFGAAALAGFVLLRAVRNANAAPQRHSGNGAP